MVGHLIILLIQHIVMTSYKEYLFIYYLLLILHNNTSHLT
jgi:hypothetical protein